MELNMDHVRNMMSARGVRCSSCGRNELTVAEHLVTLTRYEGGECYMNRNYPQVMVVCDSCDHTMLFNAQRMGLRPDALEL